MPPGARPERAILKMAQRTLRPDLRWGWVGCLFPGQNQINTSSRTLAPKPIIWAVPRLPLVQAIHAMIATIARTTIMPANRTRFAVMALDLALDLASDLAMDLLGFGFVVRYLLVSELPYVVSQLPSKAVSVLMQIKRHHWRGKRIRLLQINR